MKLEKKYKYEVELFAEGIATGTVILTKKEAEIVNYATSISNWEIIDIEPCFGSFTIDINNPIPIEE